MMASSVARMHSDEWRDPSRLASGAFAGPRLKKVLRRSQSNVCNAPSSRCSDLIVKDDRSRFNGKTSDGCARADHNVDESTSIAWRSRQSQVVDRWAARQAKDMVATIQRQAHEAELSALASRTQPVSARAATFLRETLPNQRITSFSTSSSTTSVSDGRSNAREVVADVPQNVRTSSLIQMWKELEAEAGMPLTPRTPSSGGKSGANAASAFKSEEPSIHSDRSESVSGDSVCEGTTEASSSSSSLSSSSSADEARSTAPTKGFRLWCLASSALAQKMRRDQRDLENLVARMEQGRSRELEALAERRNVSRFTYRGRLQSMLRLRSLRRQFAVRDRKPESAPRNMEQLFTVPPVSCISHEINCDGQYHDTRNPDSESSNCPRAEVPSVSDSSGDENNRCLEDVISNKEIIPQEANSAGSRDDDTQEAGSSWQSNLDRHMAASFSACSGCHSEAATEELGTYPASDSRNSSTNSIDMPPDSWRECGTSRQPEYPGLLKRLADQVELCELQERRTVTTSLASDFCNKMNRIISTFLQRRGFQHVDENRALECEHWPFRRHSERFQDFKQDSSDMDYMHDLKTDMAQIRIETIELRRLLESCMNWQDRFQQSIDKKVSDAIRQSGHFNCPTESNSTQYSSNPTPGRKGSCCICYEMQVDSLLYRCGHMCACYKCATELQLKRGKCPICSSPITDVVRAYHI